MDIKRFLEEGVLLFVEPEARSAYDLNQTDKLRSQGFAYFGVGLSWDSSQLSAEVLSLWDNLDRPALFSCGPKYPLEGDTHQILRVFWRDLGICGWGVPSDLYRVDTPWRLLDVLRGHMPWLVGMDNESIIAGERLPVFLDKMHSSPQCQVYLPVFYPMGYEGRKNDKSECVFRKEVIDILTGGEERVTAIDKYAPPVVVTAEGLDLSSDLKKGSIKDPDVLFCTICSRQFRGSEETALDKPMKPGLMKELGIFEVCTGCQNDGWCHHAKLLEKCVQCQENIKAAKDVIDSALFESKARAMLLVHGPEYFFKFVETNRPGTGMDLFMRIGRRFVKELGCEEDCVCPVDPYLFNDVCVLLREQGIIKAIKYIRGKHKILLKQAKQVVDDLRWSVRDRCPHKKVFEGFLPGSHYNDKVWKCFLCGVDVDGPNEQTSEVKDQVSLVKVKDQVSLVKELVEFSEVCKVLGCKRSVTGVIDSDVGNKFDIENDELYLVSATPADGWVDHANKIVKYIYGAVPIFFEPKDGDVIHLGPIDRGVFLVYCEESGWAVLPQVYSPGKGLVNLRYPDDLICLGLAYYWVENGKFWVNELIPYIGTDGNRTWRPSNIQGFLGDYTSVVLDELLNGAELSYRNRAEDFFVGIDAGEVGDRVRYKLLRKPKQLVRVCVVCNNITGKFKAPFVPRQVGVVCSREGCGDGLFRYVCLFCGEGVKMQEDGQGFFPCGNCDRGTLKEALARLEMPKTKEARSAKYSGKDGVLFSTKITHEPGSSFDVEPKVGPVEPGNLELDSVPRTTVRFVDLAGDEMPGVLNLGKGAEDVPQEKSMSAADLCRERKNKEDKG